MANVEAEAPNGNELLAQCRARKQPLTMVLLNGADMHDIHELVGRIASERLMLKAVQGITAALPAGGLAASMGKAEFAVLVPDVLPDRAKVHYNLGLALQQLGQRPAAEAALLALIRRLIDI